MAPLIVHNLDDEVREKLSELAKQHGRSIEDEARDILRAAVGEPAVDEDEPIEEKPKLGLGSRIAARFAGHGLKEGEIKEWRGNPIQPAEFDQ